MVAKEKAEHKKIFIKERKNMLLRKNDLLNNLDLQIKASLLKGKKSRAELISYTKKLAKKVFNDKDLITVWPNETNGFINIGVINEIILKKIFNTCLKTNFALQTCNGVDLTFNNVNYEVKFSNSDSKSTLLSQKEKENNKKVLVIGLSIKNGYTIYSVPVEKVLLTKQGKVEYYQDNKYIEHSLTKEYNRLLTME